MHHRRQRLRHVLEEAGSASDTVPHSVRHAVASLPHHDLVELDVRDRLRRRFGQRVDLVHQQKLERFLRSARTIDEHAECLCALRHDLIFAVRLRLEAEPYGLGLGVGGELHLLRLRFRFDDPARLLRLRRSLERRALLCFYAFGLCYRRARLGAVLRFLNRCLGLAAPSLRDLEGFCLLHLEVRIRGRDLLLRLRLTGDRARIRLRHRDTLLLLGVLHRCLALEGRGLLAHLLLLLELRDLHRLLSRGIGQADLAILFGVRHLHHLLAVRLGHADLTHLFLIRHVAARLLYRLRCGLLSDRLDVPARVHQIGDVHVDENQADLLELGREVSLDPGEQRVAVAVDLLDAHRRDDLAELAEDDVLRLALHQRRVVGDREESRGRVLLSLGVRSDGDGEHARHCHADVLRGERVLERNVDLQRREIEVGVFLDHGPDEGAAAGDHACRALAGHLAGDHEHLVRRAAPVARDEQEQESDYEREEKKTAAGREAAYAIQQRTGLDHGVVKWRVHGQRTSSREGVATTSTMSGSRTSTTVTFVPVESAAPLVTASYSTVRPLRVRVTLPAPESVPGIGM